MSARDESPKPTEKKYACETCNGLFTRRDSLQQHILRKHTANRVRSFTCECSAAFHDKNGLSQHKKQKHGDKNLRCEICSFVTSTKGQLRNHKQIHNPTKGFTCNWDGCSLSFRTRETLTSHLRSHQGIKNYSCDWPGCNQKFSRSSYVRIHKLIHENEKTIKCPWPNCEISFSTPMNFRSHYMIHTKPYMCKWVDCTQSFATSRQLESHVNKHKDSRPYPCQWPGCNLSFYIPGERANHTKIHLGDKLHKCTWSDCGQAFSRKEHMQNHLRTHTQEKPFVCSVESCKRAFNVKVNLTNHEKKYHLGKCVACLEAGQSESTAEFIDFRFVTEKLCITCAKFKYNPEIVFRIEYHLATYIRHRFADHPNVRAILWNSTDPDDKERCTRFRPDLRILTHTVGDGIIECDENGHNPYQCTMKEIQEAWSELQLSKQSHFERQKIKEDSRLSQLVTSGTIDRTVAWRLNPDRSIDENGDVFAENQAIDSNGNRVVMDLVAARERRFEMLGDEVQAWLDGKWDMTKLPFIYVVYMFYDGPWRQESLVPIDGDEYKIWLKELESKTRTIDQE